MPHARAAKLLKLKEASESTNLLLQTSSSSAGTEWNESMDWNAPNLFYQTEFLADNTASDLPWHTIEAAITDLLGCGNGAWPSIIGPAADPPSSVFQQPTGIGFCGLQHWYSEGSQECSSEAPMATTRPQFSESSDCSFGTISTSKGSQTTDQICGVLLNWSETSRRPSSSIKIDELSLQKISKDQEFDPTEDLQEPLSPSSAGRSQKVSNADDDVKKRRKIAHSKIEKHYRSRIKDGMAELRHCVPLTAEGISSSASHRARKRPLLQSPTQNHSSGKVATLSDAVQYVKALTDQNEALQGKLDVLHRCNNTLQKIALSNAETKDPGTKSPVDDIDAE
jgi:hypothetical protein